MDESIAYTCTVQIPTQPGAQPPLYPEVMAKQAGKSAITFSSQHKQPSIASVQRVQGGARLIITGTALIGSIIWAFEPNTEGVMYLPIAEPAPAAGHDVDRSVESTGRPHCELTAWLSDIQH